MNGHWEAPRIAYELAAEWAERARERAVRSGDAHGHVRTTTGMGKAWEDLRPVERHDVLAVLATQARSAMWEVRKHFNVTEGKSIIINDALYTPRICEQAAQALAAAVSPEGSEWKMPECSHCASLVAEALINMQVVAIGLTGIADPAVVIRMMADGMRLPGQREASDAPGM